MLFVVFSKLFHVRSVTQGDVIRADAKDIPRIFQVSDIQLSSNMPNLHGKICDTKCLKHEA